MGRQKFVSINSSSKIYSTKLYWIFPIIVQKQEVASQVIILFIPVNLNLYRELTLDKVVQDNLALTFGTTS